MVSNFNAQVVDFGVAGFSSNLKIDIEAGSLRYMPPEILSGKNKRVNPAIDIWALGCILYAMVCGVLPFNARETKEVIAKICDGDYTYPREVEHKVSPEVKDLIAKLLTVDPSTRYTVTDIDKHPWITGEKLKYIARY